MSMFICLHCGHHFDGSEIDTKFYDYATGTWEGEECPNCCSEDFEEADYCEMCEEWFPADSCTNGICKKCIERKSNDIMTLMRFAIDAFTPEELDELIDKGTFKSEVKQVALDNEYEFTETIKEEMK